MDEAKPVNEAKSVNVERKWLEVLSDKINEPSDKVTNAAIADEIVETGEISIYKLVESRATEIDVLRRLMVKRRGSVLTKLPRSMRRRAASRQPNRIPRWLLMRFSGVAHAADLRKLSKRPSRKYRRKPSNLKTEYLRRMRRCNWLTSHVWHAKRFHMRELWGWKLPIKCHQKQYRTVMSSVRNGCAIHDATYESSLLVSADTASLLNSYLLALSPGLCRSKCQSGLSMFYEDNDSILGPVQFVRLTSCSLLLSCHPSIFEAVFRCVSKTPASIVSLKSQLAKFRVFGPRSSDVMSRVFVASSASFFREKVAELSSETVWWKERYQQNESLFEEMSAFFSSDLFRSSNAGCLPMGYTVSGLFRDPRTLVSLQPTSTVVHHQAVNSASIFHKETNNFSSYFAQLLPQLDVYEGSLDNAPSTAEINKRRANAYREFGSLTGDIDLESNNIQVPAVFVARAGYRKVRSAKPSKSESRLFELRVGHGSGWDVFLPARFAPFFWTSLVSTGVKVCSLCEIDAIAVDCGHCQFPLTWLDTKVGKSLAEQSEVERQSKIARTPSSKKTGIVVKGEDNWFSEKLPTATIVRDLPALYRFEQFLLCDSRMWQNDNKISDDHLVAVCLRAVDGHLRTNAAVYCLPADEKALSFPLNIQSVNCEMIGSVLRAQYSITYGCTIGMSLVSVGGLRQRRQSRAVLFRNETSFFCHRALFKLLYY